MAEKVYTYKISQETADEIRRRQELVRMQQELMRRALIANIYNE